MDNNNLNPEEEIIILLDEEDNIEPYEDGEVDFVETADAEPTECIEYEPIEVEDATTVINAEAINRSVDKGTVKRPVSIVDDEQEDSDDEEEEDDDFLGGIATKLIMVFGIVIAILAIFVGYRMLNTKRADVEKVDFASVGASVAQLGIIGGDNIASITSAQGSKLEELGEALQNYDYDEADEETGITTVDVTLTTVLKDLKIKFVNKRNKLIANVPFKVEVTQPDGKTITVSDDDKDGIIYLSEIPGGAYGVSLVDMDGYNQYYDFTSAGKKSVTVKTQLDYKKIDVSNEIKKATEAESKKEDTKKNETAEESKLKDTVAFLMSEKILVSEGYAEIDRATVEDPITKLRSSLEQAISSRFKKLEGEVNPPPVCEHDWDYSEILDDHDNHKKTCKKNCEVPEETENHDYEQWSGDDTKHTRVCTKCKHEETESHTPSGGYVKDTDTTHKQKCSVCGLPYGNAESCDAHYDSNGICSKCGNKKQYKNISVSGKIANLTGNSGDAKYTYNSSDATKNIGAADVELAFTEGSKDDIKDIKYTWLSTDASVIAIDSSTSSHVTFKILKAGEATLRCTVEYTPVDRQSSSSFTCELKITVEGVEIKSDVAAKRAVFIGGDELVIPVTVTGGSTNEVEWSASQSGTFVSAVPENDSNGKKNNIRIKGLAEGTATLTAKSKDDSSITKTFTIVVNKHPKDDTATKLTNKEGKQLYKKDSAGKYVEAKYADYYTADKLYILGGDAVYKYTGWWTQNGKHYYYDANGKKVTGEQVILGAKYVFDSDGALKSGTGTLGIDVSTWNGTIDWSKVAKSGVNFAIIRCGFRGSTEGGLFEDNKFAANIKNATAAGLKVGVYFFTQAINETEAVEEASMCLSLVEGYKLAYPIFLDVESAGSGCRGDKISKETRTNVIKAFCKTISNGGYKAGVYANKYWYTNNINVTELTGYTIWLAQYASAYTYETTRVDMWQYSAKGSISGISGNVDLNISYLGY